jgi:hypothetical protein
MNRSRRLTSRKDWIVLVLLKKQTIMNENKRFVYELLLFENMTIISFFARSNFSFLHDLMRFCKKIHYCDEYELINTEIVCCENMSITCFASCLEMWDVIWEMRFRFVFCKDCLKWFILVIMLDHLIVSSFWSSNLIFWRMTRAHSRLSSDVCLFSICRATLMIRR